MMLANDGTQVRVLRQIDVKTDDAEVTVQPGIFDAIFLCQMLGETHYMQAYVNGHLIILHERVL